MKILLTIKENWKDPVWSKVIAAVIISIGSSFSALLYTLLNYIFAKISIVKSLDNISDFLNNDLSIKIWIIFIIAVLYLILISKPFVTLIQNIHFKIKYPKKKKVHKFILKKATYHSTVLFNNRMAEAFPGVRGITWFDNPIQSRERLEILLKEPLRFKDGSFDHESDPIWWFRGGSSLFIDKFKKLSRKKVLLNKQQLKIKKIAAYHGDAYYSDFVYVEVEGEKQTGLDNLNIEDIEEHIKTYGYSYEEYGLIKNWLGWKVPIKRTDYDDGATVRRGKVIDAIDAELRVRYLSNFNFIIAAKGSPYNTTEFSRSSEKYYDRILKGEINPDELFAVMKECKKRE